MSGDGDEGRPAPSPGSEEPTQAGPGSPGEATGIGASKKGRGVAADDSSGDGSSDLDVLYSTNLTVNGTVIAPQSVFGTSVGLAQGEASRRPRTGRLSEEEASALCERFAEPALLTEAAEALKRDQIVVLTGVGGLGKRTSAVCLLRNIGAQQLEVVSPTLTLQELSKHDFEPGNGYLVEDWQQASRADEAADFNWRVLRDHVKDSKAYLVITAAGGKAGRMVAQFAWQAPPSAAVLAAYLPGDADDTAGKVAGKIPDTYGVESIAAIGQRLAGGEDTSKILEELANDPGRHVREWLPADERTDDEIQEVTALSFAAGQSVRIFEEMLRRLEATLREAGILPDPEDRKHDHKDGDEGPKGGYVPRAAGLRGARNRSRRSGLLLQEDGRVRFLGEQPKHQDLYQRHTLQELWRDYDISFWIAVRGWLTELIGDTTIHDVQVSVAAGLASLAFVALDEVENAYLHPWAAGEQGWSGQCTAVYVLWLMSREDSLAPVALRIATNWVNRGDPVCQWTAAAALSGELGAVYPVPAASRLWHLVGQWKDVPTKAVIALATLFATLTGRGEGQQAHQVLELLRERMSRAGSRDGAGEDDDSQAAGPPVSWREDRRNRERAMLCIISVFSVHDRGTKQPSITSFLNVRPEHLGLVAELWAAILRNRPCRKRALVALLDAVRGFEYVTDDPQTAARALGDALIAALPVAELQPLSADINNILARSKRPEGLTAATVQALMDALEHLKPAAIAAG